MNITTNISPGASAMPTGSRITDCQMTRRRDCPPMFTDAGHGDGSLFVQLDRYRIVPIDGEEV